MAQNTPDPIKTQAETPAEPVIPPASLLAIAGLGVLVGIYAALTQPELGAVGIGGFAFGGLALLLWVILAPDQARGVLTGRTARYGGTSLVITVLLLAALVAVYVVVRNLDARIDLTERSDFSLTDESRQAVTALGADPSLPSVEVVAFFGATQAAQRDQNEPLLQDYAAASAGKITYRFVDPDLDPGLVQAYGVTANGQIVVAAIDPATSAPDLENAERLNFLSQEQLTNAVLKVAAQGSFRALFITTGDPVSERLTVLRDILSGQLDWDVQDVTLAALSAPQSPIVLNDPNIDGEIMIIAGGSTPLSEAELGVIERYLTGGGALFILAGTNLNDEQVSLATGETLSAYLEANFGLRFNNDVVIDQQQALQNALTPVATDFDPTAYISTTGIDAAQAAAILDLASSITISAAPPANVTVTPLLRTSPTSFATSNLAGILDGSTQTQGEGDTAGPLVVMAQAENSTTGARVILASSTALLSDDLANFGSGVANLSLGLNTVVWATDFQNYFQGITVLQQQRPQDAPMFATEEQLATVNTLVIALPFLILAVGAYVWWSNRERARA